MNQFRIGARLVHEELLDYLRQRSVLVMLIVGPLLLVLFLGVAPVVASSRGDTSNTNLHATVAVPRDTPKVVVDALDDRLRVTQPADPDAALSNDEADIALYFVDDPIEALRSGAALRIRVVEDGRPKGRMTERIARASLDRLRTEQARGTPTKLRVASLSVPDPSESRGIIAPLLPTLYVMFLGGIVGIAAGRFQGARAMRSTEMLLVRPIRRSTLLAAMASSAMLLGAASSAIVLAPVTLVALLIADHDASLAPPVVVGALLLSLTLLAVLFAFLGVAIGVSGRSLNAAAGRATVVLGGIMLVAFLLQLSDSLAESPATFWVPIANVLLIVRHTVTGQLSSSHIAQTVLTMVVATIAVATYAIRGLASDRVASRG